MKEKTLIKICIIAVLSGILLMFISLKLFEPEKIDIKNVNEKYNYVKISGKITKISKSESGTFFLEMKDHTDYIDIVIFKNSIKNIEYIKVGQEVEVTGKPEKYKEKMEIIATSIE